MGKNPLTSKTFWLNAAGILALLLQSEFGFLLAPHYQALGLAAANLVLRQLTGQPIDWSQVKLGGLPCLLLLAALSLLWAPLLSGCAAIKKADAHPVLTELAVRAAVGRVLDERPAWVELTAQISADAIQRLDSDDAVCLTALEAYVVQRIPWTALSPEEDELLRILIRAIREETEAYLQRQGIAAPGETAVRVARVLGWIHQSAEFRKGRD